MAQKDNSSSNVTPDLVIGEHLLNTINDHNASAPELPSALVLTLRYLGTLCISRAARSIPSIDVEGAYFSTFVVAKCTIILAKDDYSKDSRHLYELESSVLNINEDSNAATTIKLMNK
ncbi:hypothetical protein ANCDUO_10116 [Ancylostoma duodenale]|uniref:Uncharacterized protein n=1 Tax=Ancylostoma duodenale TaxID=51022 RepID=A0A0C2CS34_9BILA|nr:hypothetical protein ANCDUO_10116 [Ancylostoma duodenale]